MSRQHFDIAVIIPLEDEIIPFFKIFPSIEDRSDDAFLHHVVDSGHPEVSVVVIQQQKMGRAAAEAATTEAIERYDISLIACVGIAGSLSGDMRLGDVCHSGDLFDVLDNAKFSDDEDENADIEFSPTHYETPTPILTRMNYIRTQPGLAATYLEWQEKRAAEAQEEVPEKVPSPNGSDFQLGAPRTKSGAIACGAVSKSKKYNTKLRAIDRAMLAIETESGGVFFRAKKANIPVVTIRGISDYADKDKKRLEEVSKGGVRHLAASNAVSFLRLQISSNDYFRKGLSDLNARKQTKEVLPAINPASDPVSLALDDLTIAIDENLRKLSPEYRLQKQGYRLPLPRVRPLDAVDGLDASETQAPFDLRSAVEMHDRIIVNLPRTYPDQSLAWVMADDLSRADLSSQQAVPFVVNGDAIRSKHTTLAQLCGPCLEMMVATPGVLPVIIIENIPFSSKHRRETLVEQVALYPEAKFIFLTRGDTDLIAETAFSSKTAAVLYETCAISFMEIAFFIQKNFEMNGNEAEVVALRLRDTFKRFDLDAHPTYFAGIPRETLAALLQANRRSELIQLAVDGFLTFVVAGDRDDVALSRTTRARFLRQLVVDMHVEKRTFDQSQLIQRVQEFAEKHDFAIDPLSFIQGFTSHGIMHFEGSVAKISLPFIEAYLLADELSRNAQQAEIYFDPSKNDFDLVTFDLYAEIGPSAKLVSIIVEALQKSIASVTLNDDKEHILLGDSISPPNIRRPERAAALRKRLVNAQSAVIEGAERALEKQKTLDLAERIKEATSKERRQQEKAEAKNTAATDQIPTENLIRHWVIATILLGSSAEHLDASTKRGLSRDLVIGASRLIDEWSRLQARINFAELRKELTKDEILADMPGPEDLIEKKRFVEALLDLLEYAALANPLRRVLGFLCEQARHRVLAPSIAAVKLNGPMERVIHGTWLTDVDARDGASPLREAIHKLPHAAFLRITLASHYLARVYWNHWSTNNRLILLEAADE
ncbi:5'-methylthioadenosine/S-adenosylhomocysteine nucleosidase family protein [Acetobacter cerevisiae]|uniref:Nucleoside phosphorylase domain-containing protein n=1 Tax=Acetobacter cerevisiae TaxID=178900 RepID=A0A149V9H0_9PROT|nr:hypothetical protein [Acetobacter cerevisiae]KXV76553.1 hypothetical protein AD954_11090 [Acetobacter cerevisiae]